MEIVEEYIVPSFPKLVSDIGKRIWMPVLYNALDGVCKVNGVVSFCCDDTAPLALLYESVNTL